MLSAGQKRRLALSRLALSRARLWLLDEPTIGLDTASIARFGTMLEKSPRIRRHDRRRHARPPAAGQPAELRLR